MFLFAQPVAFEGTTVSWVVISPSSGKQAQRAKIKQDPRARYSKKREEKAGFTEDTYGVGSSGNPLSDELNRSL